MPPNKMQALDFTLQSFTSEDHGETIDRNRCFRLGACPNSGEADSEVGHLRLIGRKHPARGGSTGVSPSHRTIKVTPFSPDPVVSSRLADLGT